MFDLFRGPVFAQYKMMRDSRKDIFKENNTGMLMEEGEKWHEVRYSCNFSLHRNVWILNPYIFDFYSRSKVQQDLMRPKSATFYLEEIQNVAQDFVDFIKEKRSVDDHVIKDFLPEIYR